MKLYRVMYRVAHCHQATADVYITTYDRTYTFTDEEPEGTAINRLNRMEPYGEYIIIESEAPLPAPERIYLYENWRADFPNSRQ